MGQANKQLKENETEFKDKIKALTDEASDLKVTVLNKQEAINHYLDEIEKLKKELAISKCETENLNRKLTSYLNSAFVLDHIIPSKNVKSDEKNGIGYNKCPPPIYNNFAKIPEEDKHTKFVAKTPLVADPVCDKTENVDEVIIEDCVDDDSDDESKNNDDFLVKVKKFVIIVINHHRHHHKPQIQNLHKPSTKSVVSAQIML